MIVPPEPKNFFDLIWQGIASAACELAPFGVQVERFETDGHDAQRRLLHKLITSQKASPLAALALVPAHVSMLNGDLDRLIAMGVPVVTFHTDAPFSHRTTYVGADHAQSGALAGELLGKMMRGVGCVASFPGSFETEHLAQRYVGFRDELKRCSPAIQEAMHHTGHSSLGAAADDAFSRGAKIHGVYVGDSQAHIVAEVMESRGLRVPCFGFDDTPATRPFLKRGTVSAVIDESPYQQGYLALQQAYEAIGGSREERFPWVEVAPDVVFSANANVSDRIDARNGPFERMMRQRTRKLVLYQDLLAEANARIVSLSDTDPLTGLANRRRFEEVLDLHARANDGLSLMIIGMNGVSQATDEALINLAKVLRAHVRPQDCCARLSADEFGILMPQVGATQAGDVRRSILTMLDKMLIAPKTLKLHLQASIGVASMPFDAQNAEDLLVLADSAMCAHRRSSFVGT